MSHQRGDEAELFARYHERLVRATAFAIATSPDNVEEACAYAWMQLLVNDVRRDTAFAWLKQVARREAMRLKKLDHRAVPLGQERGAIDPEFLPAASNPDVTPERWTEAMSRLSRLPERDRRLVLMRAFGWKYAEIAEVLGLSYTRVDRILARADAHLRDLDERQTPARTARGARMRELEEDPPRWLRDAIGRRPAISPRRGDISALIREWRRLALAIDDYRQEHGIDESWPALGPRAATRDQRVQRDALRARIQQFTLDRGPSR